MISAEEAKNKTATSTNKKVVFELEEIEKSIEKAILNGYFSISGDGSLQRGTIEELKKLGYEVCPSYTISWR